MSTVIKNKNKNILSSTYFILPVIKYFNGVDYVI